MEKVHLFCKTFVNITSYHMTQLSYPKYPREMQILFKQIYKGMLTEQSKLETTLMLVKSIKWANSVLKRNC